MYIADLGADLKPWQSKKLLGLLRDNGAKCVTVPFYQ